MKTNTHHRNRIWAWMVAVQCLLSLNQVLGQVSAYPESKLGWKISIQASTYRRFSFLETLDKVKACGLTYIEGFTTQRIGGDMEGLTDYHMDTPTISKLRHLLKEKGVKMISYGVVTPHSAIDWKQLFEFGKAMGIQTFASEPDTRDLPLVDSLCSVYGINVAIHNHANPSPYWNPDILLAAIQGRSQHIGACADIGHWMRSGLDPLACLGKLKGHIISVHMKDLNVTGNIDAHDVRWGEGEGHIQEVIDELKAQQFRGVIAVEYEYNRDELWYDSVPDIQASLRFFRNALK